MMRVIGVAIAVFVGGCGGTWAPPRQITEAKPQLMITTRPTTIYYGGADTNRCKELTKRPEYMSCTSAVPKGAKQGLLPDGMLVEVLDYPVTWSTTDLTASCQGMARVSADGHNGLVLYADLIKPDSKKRRGIMFVANPDGQKARDLATGEETLVPYGERVERLSCGDDLFVDSHERTLLTHRSFLSEDQPDPAYPRWQSTCGVVEKRVASAHPLPSPATLATRPATPDTLFRLTFDETDVALVSHTPGDYAYTLQTKAGAFLVHTKVPMSSDGYAGDSIRKLLVRATGNVRDLRVMKAVEVEAVAGVFPCFYDPKIFGAPDLKSNEGR